MTKNPPLRPERIAVERIDLVRSAYYSFLALPNNAQSTYLGVQEEARPLTPTTESGRRSIRNAAMSIDRDPSLCLRWLNDAPDWVKEDMEIREGMTLLGATAIKWLTERSMDRPRLQRKTTPAAK